MKHKDDLLNDQFYGFKLMNLYKNNLSLFNEVVDYLPYSVHVNQRKDLSITYASLNLKYQAKEIEFLLEYGAKYLPEITTPSFLKNAKMRIKHFDSLNDNFGVCSYLQEINLESKKSTMMLYTHKMILDEFHYFNISSFLGRKQNIGLDVLECFSVMDNEKGCWGNFQKLTKREKEVLQLLIQGHSNKITADKLCISKHTVETHRKNINKKLEIKGIRDYFQYAMLLGLD